MRWTRTRFVEPETPGGEPAVMTTMSPGAAAADLQQVLVDLGHHRVRGLHVRAEERLDPPREVELGAVAGSGVKASRGMGER